MTDALYCSVQDMQRETGNNDADLVAWFEVCIEAASRWIDDYCHRDFGFHDHSATAFILPADQIVSEHLILNWPIITLTEVKMGELVIESSLYTFTPGRRMITMANYGTWVRMDWNKTAWDVGPGGKSLWSKTYGDYQLKGTFGYAANKHPAAIRRACTIIASAWSHEKRREKVTYDGQRTSLLDERIPDDSLMLLKRFKRVVV